MPLSAPGRQPGPGCLASLQPGTTREQDLHRSFSSRVPLEVTDSAWMNSENSIRPSCRRERGRRGLVSVGQAPPPTGGDGWMAAGTRRPSAEQGREGMRFREDGGVGGRGGLEMGQARRRDSDRASQGESLTPQLVEGTASSSLSTAQRPPEPPSPQPRTTGSEA